MTNLTHNSFIL